MIVTNSQKKFFYLGGILIALLFSIGLGYFFTSIQDEGKNYNGNLPEVKQNISVTEKNSVAENSKINPEPEKKQPEEVAEKIPEIPPQTGALNPLDLSLGSLSIDDSEEKVYKVLGQPPAAKVEDYGTRLKYDLLDVVLRNGKISAFVCRLPSLKTPRGLHSGSTADEVFSVYGKNFLKSRYEDLILYEYKIVSADGHNCLLRFAVNDIDGIVDYISMRYAD